MTPADFIVHERHREENLLHWFAMAYRDLFPGFKIVKGYLNFLDLPAFHTFIIVFHEFAPCSICRSITPAIVFVIAETISSDVIFCGFLILS